MTDFKFKYAQISDIHLGHPHTTTEEIIGKLEKAFPDTPETASLDAIFIVGDLFDRLLWLNDDNVALVKFWMYNLLLLCKKHDIMLRVLEGTPSHDRKQPKMFMTIKEISSLDVDVKYIDKLDIEFIDKFGISVLYVPDEWKPDTDEVWMDVKNALARAGIEKVDYAFMHGAFCYQLPDIDGIPKHIEERYLSVVKRLISIGHVHDKSRYDRIIAQGSFDRLGHGYESPKGHYVIESIGDTDTATFVENKDAKIYMTIDCRGLTLEEAMTKIDTYSHYPVDSYMRIRADSGDAILSALSTIKQKYVGFNWTTKSDSIRRSPKQVAEIVKTKFIPVNITQDNIVGMVEKRLQSKGVDPSLIEHCIRLLEAGRTL